MKFDCRLYVLIKNLDPLKIFLYKEDFNKFLKALNEAVDHVKSELMPDFDFDAFNHEYDEDGQEGGSSYEAPSSPSASSEAPPASTAPSAPSAPSAPDMSSGDNGADETVDKW